ncbi:hypothetical protein WOLCODRAFT_145639 [Wolfiporia cocos MD-104 SS10]|uniref:ABC transmembrane type-1 domain-containing protein n=1 Tax=Wolfiporia cocos (strain MD-104) TaxID=742152 RepID=A0A2H3IZC3_WOLCO|nr:hypothetical protein WOLCODRAFT_145639 [Wolfiporia cocos MD-104 SS10]
MGAFQVYMGVDPAMQQPMSLAPSPSEWQDSLAFPAYATAVSAVIFLLELLLRRKTPQKPHVTDAQSIDSVNTHDRSQLTQCIQNQGGLVSVVYKMARFLSCCALFGLSAASLFALYPSQLRFDPTAKPWLAIGQCTAFAYASVLALVTLASGPKSSEIASRHLSHLLLLTWAVYVYRDVWPLATYTHSPADAADGVLLWVKFALLTFAAVVMPLCTPHQYVPLDPEEKMTPHPTQTASILSNILYTWLDSTVIEAQRVSHLDFDRLPPLADRDHSKILVKRSFSHLDPFQTRSQRHIFWGLMRVFWTEYIVLCLMLISRTIAYLASPVGVNRLLNYLEHGGTGMTVRPWVWIGFLFLGPVLGSLAFQWYLRTATHALVQTEAIITQLVFDHALRIRVKSDAEGASPPATPDSASAVAPAPGADADRAEETSGAADRAGAEAGTQADTGKNLAGRINNLVTTDLENILNGRDFPFLFVEIPLQLVLSTWFLYSLLGWSALAGMAVMGAMMPLPGYIATFLQRIQIEKMKRTDARVQTVTENLGVIRMIKLFGWEPRVAEQLAEKRAEELEYQKKFKLLEFLNNYITHLIPIVSMVVTYALFCSNHSVQKYSKCLGWYPESSKTELLDAYADELNGTEPKPLPAASDIIGFKDTSFTWANNNDGTLTPRRRNFTLRIEGELFFKRGCVNLVVGPTGSGKTSLLMALLG